MEAMAHRNDLPLNNVHFPVLKVLVSWRLTFIHGLDPVAATNEGGASQES